MFVYRVALMAIFFSPHFLSAQAYDDPKFGKITDEERTMMTYPADTSADAVVLFDRMAVDFVWDDEKGPKLHENYIRRVKLLKSSSFDRGDLTIGYNRGSEKISGLKAAIHLPSGETLKIKKGDIVHEKVNDDYGEYKIAFPQVTEGAVLEYAYDKYNDYITSLPRYYFQEGIPVKWAEYRASIPAYYHYISLGTNSGLDIATTTKNQVAWGPVFRAGGNNQVEHTRVRYAIRDQKAYETQPYTNNFRDYISQVRLQLQAVVYPNQPVNNVFNNWSETAKELGDNAGFGKIYGNGGNYNKVWKEAGPLISAGATDTEKVQAAYEYVADNIEWNRQFRLTAENTPDKLLDVKTGSVAEMNLMLVALLREAGIEAHPMLVSLRNSGAPIEFYPIISQFSTTLVYAEVDGKPMILDVNEADRPAGLPRVSALNHRGWVADVDNPRWVDIEVPSSSKLLMSEVVIDAEGMAEVTMKGRMENYYAFYGRDQIKDMETNVDAPFADDILELFPDAQVLDFGSDMKDADEVGKLNIELTMQVPVGEVIDDYLYVRPNLIPVLEKELADVKERLYPVDFPYPWVERFITTIKIPEGYAVEELPESTVVRTPDNQASVMLAAEDKGDGTISVNFSINMAKTFYEAKDYEQLRQIFENIIAMQEATIVLKRSK